MGDQARDSVVGALGLDNLSSNANAAWALEAMGLAAAPPTAPPPPAHRAAAAGRQLHGSAGPKTGPAAPTPTMAARLEAPPAVDSEAPPSTALVPASAPADGVPRSATAQRAARLKELLAGAREHIAAQEALIRDQDKENVRRVCPRLRLRTPPPLSPGARAAPLRHAIPFPVAAPLPALGPQTALRDQLRFRQGLGSATEGEAAMEAELELRKEVAILRETAQRHERAAAEAEVDLTSVREAALREAADTAQRFHARLADAGAALEVEKGMSSRLKQLLKAARAQLAEQREVIEAQVVQLARAKRRASALAAASASAPGATVRQSPGRGVGPGSSSTPPTAGRWTTAGGAAPTSSAQPITLTWSEAR